MVALNYRFILMSLIYGSLLYCPVRGNVTQADVIFQDTQLKKSVERTLGKADPNRFDMLLLEKLDVANESIKSLGGLEYASNLRCLDISYNDVTQIQLIYGIKGIEELNISGCKIEDIAGISRFKTLQKLWAQNCDLSDISFLANLRCLFHLDLTENLISDIAPLISLNRLKVLALEDNVISDISVLSQLTHLSELMLGGNQIEDISALSKLSSIEYLTLYDNKIHDISGLKGLPQLEMLSINDNPLSSNSTDRILPEVWEQNRDNFLPITINIDGGEYCPSSDSYEKTLVFSRAAALSPDGNYLLCVAGPAGNSLSGLEGGWVILCQINGGNFKNHKYIPVIEIGAMGGAVGSVGWRNKKEFHVLTNMRRFGSYRLFVYSLREENNKLEVKTEYSQTHTPFTLGLKWSPCGRYLSGRTLTWGKKKTAILDYTNKMIRKYELPYSNSYCWADQNTLYACIENQIICSKPDGIAESEQSIVGMGNNDACIGGAIDGKPVYALDDRIYLGESPFYRASADVEEIFLGKTQVAFVSENVVSVVNLEGEYIFGEKITNNEVVLAFSEERGVLYLLSYDRKSIESCNILNNGKRSTLCTVDEFKGNW